jgi:hypothetical protein
MWHGLGRDFARHAMCIILLENFDIMFGVNSDITADDT